MNTSRMKNGPSGGGMSRCGSVASSYSCDPSSDELSKDSGLGDCGPYDANAPTDFASMREPATTTKNLNREMKRMHIRSQQVADILALEEEDEDVDEIENDENARDCDSSFTKMPPPSTIPARRPFEDLGNRLESPLSSKRLPRHASANALQTTRSTGGLSRKRLAFSPSTFGQPERISAHKRWRVAESIDELSEVASTSRTQSTDSHPISSIAHFARPSFHRVQSSSILEKGRYAPHSEDFPSHLEVSYRLPHLDNVDSQAYRRITGETLCTIMNEHGLEHFEKRYCLIDCRYPYEFEGGHIKTATNIYDPLAVEKAIFNGMESLLRSTEEGVPSRIPIFYCEYSQKRGPNMASAVRACDRIRNQLNYPRVDHAEMYVLDLGYNGFHAKHGSEDVCSPFAYTRMDDERFSSELRKFVFHKKAFSACATVSRLPQPLTQQSKQMFRSTSSLTASPTFAPSCASTGLPRRASRRALYPSSPRATSATVTAPRTPSSSSMVAPVLNPHFS